MPKRQVGKSKLTPMVRRRLAEVAKDARQWVFGAAGCPEWGTSFAEMEDDAKEVGHEFMRVFLEQAVGQQAADVPESALESAAGEQGVRAEEVARTIETESGEVSWREPAAYLPKSRRDFFPSDEGVGAGGGSGSISQPATEGGAPGYEAAVVSVREGEP